MPAQEMTTVSTRDTIDVSRPRDSSESAAIIQVIERAALNPNVDIDKMQRLLDMQERIMARNAKAAYDAAFSVMQPELPIVVERGGIKNNTGKVQSTYALWEDVNEAIRPILAKHGFAISFRVGRADSAITVTGILSHREGHREETTMLLPIDTSGSKNAVQSVGSSTSYGKRYVASALLNLSSRGEDDDGHAGGRAGNAGESPITERQACDLHALIDEVKASKEIFLRYYKIDRVEDLPASRYANAIAKLETKRHK